MDSMLTSETLLMLAERPGDLARDCGELIAERCRAGRPPFVVVLTDGPVRNPAADAAVRRELSELGLDSGRMLMFGLAGAVPAAGPVFDAAVHALCFVAWRHDCNVVVAPLGGPASAVARAAVEASGLGLAVCAAGITARIAAPRCSVRDA